MSVGRSHDPRTATVAALHSTGLGWSPFARRYSGNRCCFLLHQVLRCFSSLGSLRTPMYSVHGDRLDGAGCPIRKSPDRSLCSGSPKLFAATYVLRRLLTPRHPPCALRSLTNSRLLFPKAPAVSTKHHHCARLHSDDASSPLHRIFKELGTRTLAKRSSRAAEWRCCANAAGPIPSKSS